MGECGCTFGNSVFKLKAPNGWYVIEFLSGCDYCSASPGIQIHHPEAVEPIDWGFDSIKDMESMPDLPTIGEGEHCITTIKCGLDPDEVQDAASKCFTGAETEGNKIDTTLAEILGEDLWKEALCNAPSVVC